MIGNRSAGWLALWALIATPVAAQVDVAAFFRDKQLKLVVGSAAGSGSAPPPPRRAGQVVSTPSAIPLLTSAGRDAAAARQQRIYTDVDDPTGLVAGLDELGALAYYGELLLQRTDRDGARAMLARLRNACPAGCEPLVDLQRAMDAIAPKPGPYR